MVDAHLAFGVRPALLVGEVALRIDTLIVAGFSTSGRVQASTLDALPHGFAPFVVSDACANRHPGPHAANLFDPQAKYAMLTAAAAVALLAGADS